MVGQYKPLGCCVRFEPNATYIITVHKPVTSCDTVNGNVGVEPAAANGDLFWPDRPLTLCEGKLDAVWLRNHCAYYITSPKTLTNNKEKTERNYQHSMPPTLDPLKDAKKASSHV